MIIDTSNALAAPGSSRGYACLSVACRSIAPPGCVAGGCPRRAAGPSVPLSADTVSLTRRLCGRGGCRPREGRRGREVAPRPLACRASGVGLFPCVSASSRRKRPFGCRCPWGCSGGWGRSRAARRRGRGPAGVVVVVGSCLPVRRRSPSCPRRRCFPAPGWRAPPPPPPRGAFPRRRASAARARFPATAPRGSRPAGTGGWRSEAESACASAPRGRVPRRRPAGRRGVCPAAARSSPRAVAVPRFAPRSSRREGAVCGGGGGGGGPFPSPARVHLSAAPLPPCPSRGPPARAPCPAPPRRLPSASPSRDPPRGRRRPARVRARARVPSETRPQIRRGDPLNLSILVSGGKETNQDSLSNGE